MGCIVVDILLSGFLSRSPNLKCGASCILSMLVYVTFTPKKRDTSQPKTPHPLKFLSSNPVTRKIRTVVSRLASCRSMSKMDGTEVIDASDLLCPVNRVYLINAQHSVSIYTDYSSMHRMKALAPLRPCGGQWHFDYCIANNG